MKDSTHSLILTETEHEVGIRGGVFGSIRSAAAELDLTWDNEKCRAGKIPTGEDRAFYSSGRRGLARDRENVGRQAENILQSIPDTNILHSIPDTEDRRRKAP